MAVRPRTLIALLSAATLFEGYDRFIVPLALPYIGRDFGASQGDLGWALSAIRIGGALSLLVAPLADRFGRRALLLVSVAAYTAASAATALARDAVTFVACQFVASAFLLAEVSVAQVVVAEELPADRRARGQAWLGASGAVGAGLAAAIFPALLPSRLGWRSLYLIAVVALPFLAWMWRALPETRRYLGARGDPASPRAFSDLLRPPLRARFLILCALSFAFAAAAGASFNFASWRATETFGWTPGGVTRMVLVGGGVGMVGWLAWGRLAERVGRRAVGLASFVGSAGAIALLYRTPALLPCFALAVFMDAGAVVAVSTLGTELFPTRVRATARSWLTGAQLLGVSAGLGACGALADRLGGVAVVIPLLAVVPALAAPAFLALPESRGRELEEMA